MRFSLLLLFCAAIAAVVWAQNRPAAFADLVLRNGKIVTNNPVNDPVEALAVRGDRIAAVGRDAAIAGFIGPQTKVIDLHGMLAIPGFIEGHGHFLGVGEFRLGLDLREARTWDDIVAQVAKAAAKARPGEWIVGRGWHQSKWTRTPEPNVEGFPVHAALSKVSLNNPVMLTHASGHAVMVNAKAMEAAGITSATPNPAGGDILKDKQGNPTGILREAAEGLATRAYNRWRQQRPAAERQAELRRIIQLATDECLSKGITTFEDAGSSLATVDTLRDMARNNQLRIRLWVMLSDPDSVLAPVLDRYRIIGEGNNHLTVRAIKRYMDGALGSRTAWMLEPYADKPDSVGINTTPPAEIRKTAELAIQHNFQLCVHAIGDQANREALNVYQQVLSEHPEKNPDAKNLRWRIEHAQHLNIADIPRFGELGVIAMMQGIHCTSDAPYVLERLGPKRAEEGAYVWRKLIGSGAVVGNGTDAPVEDVNPIPSFYATVTRKLKDGTVFYPAQRLRRSEALITYTANNAFAAFEDRLKGALDAGKLADITVLSRDILNVPDDDILKTEVVYTIVGGKMAYDRATGVAK